MTVAVTDQQVATLRAHLSGNFEEYRRFWDQLDEEAAGTGYMALIDAAFFKAVNRRFKDRTVAEIIEFVAAVRARYETVRENRIDPIAAERLIRAAALGDGSVDDIDDQIRFSTEVVLLSALILDKELSAESFDESMLDGFLAEARKLADSWLT